MSVTNGRHLSFPFRIGSDGRSASATTLEEQIRDELMQLLLTAPGERVNLPEFGGGVRTLIFEPLDEATRGMAKARITQSLSTWLGHRVTLEDLTVIAELSTLEVEIRYRIAGTNDSRVMRFHRIGE